MIMGIGLASRFAVIVGIILWVVIRSLVLLKNKKYKRLSIRRELLLNIFAFYLVSVISITMFPIYLGGAGAPNRFGPAVNIMPFVNTLRDLSLTHFSLAFKIKLLIRNLAGNLILLLPLGMFLPMLWIKGRSFWKTVIIGASMSISIELLQYILAYLGYGWGRITDIDDLILNTLGVMIGYVIFDKVLIRLNFLSRLTRVNR